MTRTGDDHDRPPPDLETVLRVVDRLDALADTAELMDDHDGAEWLRAQAVRRRLEAMATLDD